MLHRFMKTGRRGLAAFAVAAVVALPQAAGAQINWTDWMAPGTPGTLFGTMMVGGTSVAVTYTGPAAFYQTGAPGETDYWRTGGTPWPAYDGVTNAPTGTDMIALNVAGTHTLTFSHSLNGLYMAFVSVGQPNLPVSYTFDAPFGIVDQGRGHFGAGPLVASGNTLTGFEGHGVIRFDGDVSSLQFTNAPNEFWHGFNVGATTVTPEPATLALLATGFVGLAGFARLRRRDSTEL